MSFAKRIPIPIYFGHLTIIQTDDIVAEVKKHGKEIDCFYEAVTFTKYLKNGGEDYVIVFLYDAQPSVIAHESVHVKNYIFLDRGIKPDCHNDENEAYLLGWIVSQCHKYLKVKQS